MITKPITYTKYNGSLGSLLVGSPAVVGLQASAYLVFHQQLEKHYKPCNHLHYYITILFVEDDYNRPLYYRHRPHVLQVDFWIPCALFLLVHL